MLEIVKAAVDRNPKRLILSGNDKRSTVVEWAYHICTMCNGPKLVTTPGSQFSSFCSLLFESVSGISDESLSGAINRYARSNDRKQWDEEGAEELEADEDNFVAEKREMKSAMREIELCSTLCELTELSTMAELLLKARIVAERQKYEKASTTYGPRQVLISHLNSEQLEDMLVGAAERLSPKKFEELNEIMSSGKSLDALDIELGKLRRLSRSNGLDQ